MEGQSEVPSESAECESPTLQRSASSPEFIELNESRPLTQPGMPPKRALLSQSFMQPPGTAPGKWQSPAKLKRTGSCARERFFQDIACGGVNTPGCDVCN